MFPRNPPYKYADNIISSLDQNPDKGKSPANDSEQINIL